MGVLSRKSLKILLLVVAMLQAPGPLLAQVCPEIDGIPDLNCDGKVQIAFIGDSIVNGYGDKENNNRGGYVVRLQKRFNEAIIKGIGVNGLKTGGLIDILKSAFDANTNPEVRDILINSDVVIIDMGRNDRLADKTAPETYRALQKAANKIRSGVKRFTGFSPMVVTSVMVIPSRPQLVPFVKSLDNLILKGSLPEKPADLRFDKLKSGLLTKDNLHPSSEGYEALANIAEIYLKDKLPARIIKLQAEEEDASGETAKSQHR